MTKCKKSNKPFFMKINILAFAKFQALMGALIGVLLGILYSIGGFFYDLLIDDGLNYGTALAFFALLGMPLIFGMGGFFLGIGEGILFNIFSKWLGKVKLNFEQ